MKLIVQGVRGFLGSEDGPTAVEYAVMLALIITICFTAIMSVGTSTSSLFGKMSSSLGD